MIPDLDPSTGLLPRGRYPATLEELEERFVTNERRSDIWDDFMAVTEELQATRAKWPMVWVSGTFASHIENPSDIDVVYFLNADRVMRPETIAKIDKILTTTRMAADVLVDCYSVGWQAWARDDLTDPAQRYRAYRGYWDDFWERAVPKAERGTFDRPHAFPRRGYLEVILDGHQ